MADYRSPYGEELQSEIAAIRYNEPMVTIAPVPREVRAANGELSIMWSDLHAAIYNARNLRLGCKCAACIDEWTHQPLINPATVPPVVKPSKIQVVGNYALQFDWSDGHTTGIYTYEYLRSLCECGQCARPRSFEV